MFGWFKKKQQLSATASRRDHETLARTAAMLEMQLMLCKADNQKYEKFIHGNYARGYFIGFFDASMQYANIPVMGDEHFATLIGVGHTYLFKGDAKTAMNFSLDSLMLQGNEEFGMAQAEGGKDYFESLQGQIRAPVKLMNKFHADDGTNA
ncbi:hypothetical protein AKN88_06120 [Thiopseudomonas alkaliphila]|uniref:Uncharacterized protein n=1 Tax=Thiopseudomonas alkaliphila TaxID=1697053 RepID=A0A0K1XEE3_9GAMM|nr:hypothetical protein [Thiopseudomonas alkaliphila]AKX59548.1 hypothetical protein AKN88_06120 [Thiopseudomonas alkaliphila]